MKLSIQKALKDLPALPEVVTKVLHETEKPDCTAASVERLMSSDQAITGKVLRVVNSAYYGLSGQVSNLGQAIVILGIQQVRNLVLSVGALGALHPKTPRQQEMLKQFWLHSFGTAAATQILGQHRRMTSAELETLFVGGIMHDVGKLFLFCYFSDAYDEVEAYSKKTNARVIEAEQKLLGITHCEIGREIAERWRLPEELVAMIGLHEGPFDGKSRAQVALVHIGDTLTQHLYRTEGGGTETADSEVPRATIDPRALDAVNLTEEEVWKITNATDEKINDAASILGLIAA